MLNNNIRNIGIKLIIKFINLKILFYINLELIIHL